MSTKLNSIIISNNDLKRNKYSKEILINNIDNLLLDNILVTQKLELDFVVKYILNDKYQTTSDEKNIDIPLVLQCQPHLKESDIVFELSKII